MSAHGIGGLVDYSKQENLEDGRKTIKFLSPTLIFFSKYQSRIEIYYRESKTKLSYPKKQPRCKSGNQ